MRILNSSGSSAIIKVRLGLGQRSISSFTHVHLCTHAHTQPHTHTQGGLKHLARKDIARALMMLLHDSKLIALAVRDFIVLCNVSTLLSANMFENLINASALLIVCSACRPLHNNNQKHKHST